MKQLKVYNIDEIVCTPVEQQAQTFDMITYEKFKLRAQGFRHPHRQNYFMIFWGTGGKGLHLIDFEKYELQAGRIFLMYPGMIHAWESSQDLEGFLLFFTADFFSQRYNDNKLSKFPFFSSTQAQPHVDFEGGEKEKLDRLFAWMYEAYEAGGNDCQSTLKSYLNLILLQCNKHYESKHVQSVEVPHAQQVLVQFEKLIDQHFRQKHQVKDYASLLHLTPNYLNVICKSHIGKSAGNLIRERILLEIKRKLLHEDKTMAEISLELHFEDQAYFSRFFKRYTGQSPLAFRKQLWQNRHK
ncbi:MAG: helix-turn-helix domain-containing protein, partial [Bacteroidota bacterium]